MAKRSGNSESVVKIDAGLLKEVEEFINRGENRLLYANKKQFVNIAVYEMLKQKRGNHHGKS